MYPHFLGGSLDSKQEAEAQAGKPHSQNQMSKTHAAALQTPNQDDYVQGSGV